MWREKFQIFKFFLGGTLVIVFQINWVDCDRNFQFSIIFFWHFGEIFHQKKMLICIHISN